MEESIRDLKRCVQQYRNLDDELRTLNKEVYEKRESRKMLEVEMSDIIKQPGFNNVDRLKIDDDGSLIRIRRPETYAKPWSLSKKELETLVGQYFQNAGTPSANGCLDFILEERKKALVSKEFEFIRVIKDNE